MAKKERSYERCWSIVGTIDTVPDFGEVLGRLERNPVVEAFALNPDASLVRDQPDKWWTCDAVWHAPDGARIRGRLHIRRQVDQPRSDKEAPSAHFRITAEADRPWDLTWPSPLAVLLDRKFRPGYAALRYDESTAVEPKTLGSFTGMLRALIQIPWAIPVFTHQQLDLRTLLRMRDFDRPVPLAPRLPSGLHGRLFDLRVFGEQDRQLANRALERYDAHLPEGGATILLSAKRRKGLRACDLTFPMTPPLSDGGDLGPLTATLARLSEGLLVDEEAIDAMRKDWTLLTEGEKRAERTGFLNSAQDIIDGLRERNASLSAELASSSEALAAAQALISQLSADRDEARERSELDRRELNLLRKAAEDDPLARRLREAEAEVELAEELLDEQNHELVLLRRENARLHRDLARAGEAVPSVPRSEADPAGWDELLAWCASLDHVVVGDIRGEIDKLRGHDAEKVWVRRSWEALRALEEYVQLKRERGAGSLPHFHAYLVDPSAENAIPRTRYSSTESKGVMMNSRFVAARTLPVPPEVDPLGRVVMEAHIRIGSGKPPAPRMHFHDDSSGSTGKVYVGHLGPHLPNYQTN